jgi:MFS family permease
MVAAIGCTAAAALGLGGLLPLLSLSMERMAVPGYLIGLNAAMPFLSAMLVMPFVPWLMAKLRTARLLLAMALLSASATLIYGLYTDITFWFFVRFINGAALGVLFAISEAWINHYAPDAKRGRVIGIYVTTLGSCFALGPVILLVAGTQGLAPFALCAILILLAALPVLWAFNLPEAFRREETEHHESFLNLMFVAPTLALAGIIYGAIEVVVVTFMPVYSLRLGFAESLAIITLTAFSLGNICCQIPLGMIADKVGRRKILMLCALVATSAMILLAGIFALLEIFDLFAMIVFAITLFIFGGSAVGIYTMAMAEMGERFKGASLASANAALVFCYNLGSILPPVLAGEAMDSVPIVGLPLLLAIICFSVLLPSFWRGLRANF